jgi:hypothetical protein
METKEVTGVKEFWEVTRWTNKKVTDWVNSNFDCDCREAVFAALLWIGDTFDMNEELGIETERIGG